MVYANGVNLMATETWQEQLKRLREEKARSNQSSSSSIQSSSSSAKRPKQVQQVQKPSSSSVAQDLPIAPMPIAVQDATNPERVLIKDGSQGTDINPATIAGSFFFPLAIDEIETHGFSRPGTLIAKGAGDAALTFVPVGKAAVGGARVASKLYGTARAGGKALDRGTKLAASSFTSPRLSNRIIGGSAVNAADNIAVTGIQNAVDNRDHSNVAELGVAGGLGGAIGVAQGVIGYNKMIPFVNQLRNKVNTLQPNSKLAKDLDRMTRHLEDDVSRAEGMADLINKYGYNELGIPRTWEDIFKVIDNEIAAENAKRKVFRDNLPTGYDNEIRQSKYEIAKQLNLDTDIDPSTLRSEQEKILLRKPVFANENEEKRFFDNIDSFLKKNNLGEVDRGTGSIVVAKDKSVQDIDDFLDAMEKPDLKTKGIKDWQGSVRRSVRDVLGTERHVPGQPSQSFAQSQRNLEHLFNEKTLLNRISGGQGLNPSPNKFSFIDRISPATAPAFGLIDFNPNLVSRNIGQAGVNLVDRAGDMQEQIEKTKQAVENTETMQQLKDMGLDTPDKVKAYFESLQASMPSTVR